MNTMKLTLTLAAFLYPTNADGLPKWSLADIDGCLETSINIPALKLTKFGTGIDGAKTNNITRATCVEKGYTNQTKAFFGEGNDRNFYNRTSFLYQRLPLQPILPASTQYPR